jgi:hypothetical protein
MSTTQMNSGHATQIPSATAAVDLKLEVITIPVSASIRQALLRGAGVAGRRRFQRRRLAGSAADTSRLPMLHPPWHDGGAGLGAGIVSHR